MITQLLPNTGIASLATVGHYYVLKVKVSGNMLTTRSEEHHQEFEDSCEQECTQSEQSETVDESTSIPNKGETTESESTKNPEARPIEHPYLCRHCELGLDVQYYICPNCGSYNIQRRKWCQLTGVTF